MGSIILNQEFLSPYNVNATASLNQAVIEWFNPVTSSKEKLQYDNEIPYYSLTNEPYEDVWLGNLFENEEMITITSIEVYWDIYELAHDFITVDILDELGNILVSSEPVQTFNDSLMTIDIPNITVDGNFYGMIHWQDNEFSTDALAMDFSDTLSNVAYIKYPDQDFILLSDFIGTPNSSFILRANTLKEDNLNADNGPISYNIFRGLADEIGDAESWVALNTEPITELTYIDNGFVIDDQDLYSYAVEAVYEEGSSDKTFSIFLELITGINEITKDDVKIYPNPASNYINIEGVSGTTITIYNMIGARVYSENIEDPISRIDISNLVGGNYFIEITGSESDRQIVKKLVITK
jgi:hypothetical protein